MQIYNYLEKDIVEIFTQVGITEWVCPIGVTEVDFLVIAGGGGSSNNFGAGGGAGGYRTSFNNKSSGGGGATENKLSVVPGLIYKAVVGAAGVYATITDGTRLRGSNGGNSSFSTITSIGGGAGAPGGNGAASVVGSTGGSGGGSTRYPTGGPTAGGLGTANQGYKSGTATTTLNNFCGSGGGGAGGTSANVTNAGGIGGVGLTSDITGTAVIRAAGGSGYQITNQASGIGGAYQIDATTNTGSGGGVEGLAADGIVIIRYKKPFEDYSIQNDTEISNYPIINDVCVKATSKNSTSHFPYYAVDPTKPLTDVHQGNAWISELFSYTNQRFHIDLGEAKVINKIYYENIHASGSYNTRGAKNFTFWGSNVATAFEETTYATDTDWTQITGLTQTFFQQHSASNAADPKYIYIPSNTSSYRYYAFKIADNYSGDYWIGMRRIELKTEAVVSTYPLLQTADYVKATTTYNGTSYYPYFATDPSKLTTGTLNNNSWVSASGTVTNQRFHIDTFNNNTIVKRIYVENAATDITDVSTRGVKNFTFWGSNTGTAFAELTYATDTNWTQITGLSISQIPMRTHDSAVLSVPVFVDIPSNTTPYRYYAFKFADNWGFTSYMMVRRIELQKSISNSLYPSAYDANTVKATNTHTTSYPYYTINPTKSLTGNWTGNCWLSGVITNQRFHIDLGSVKLINRIYYENYHSGGSYYSRGAKNFTFWGSNDATAFAELTYATDTDWTQITGLTQTFFDIHVSGDVVDQKFIEIPYNTTPYRYYAFKFADNWGHGTYMGVRRIELQQYNIVSDYFPFKDDFNDLKYNTADTTVNSCSNSILDVTSTSTNPYIDMITLGSFDTTKYKFINVRYKVVSGTANHFQIFFLNTAYIGAHEDQVVNTSLISDNEWHTVTANMGDHAKWTDSNLTGFRFDWCVDSGVNMQIDYIELV